MKKYLSFILTICILLGCASLISCNFEGIFGKTSSSTESTEPDASTKPSEQPTQPTEPTQSTTQPTEPTSSSSSVTEPKPEELVFEHGDNFTEEDIEFVKSLQGEYKGPSGHHTIYSFSSMVDGGKHDIPIYHITLNLDNPYYICAYSNLGAENPSDLIYLNVSQYVWYKFYDIENIPKTIDGKQRDWIYLVYDGIIKRDIASGMDCEYHCKYYFSKNRVLLTASSKDFLGYYPYQTNNENLSNQNYIFISPEHSGYAEFSLHNYNGSTYLYFMYDKMTVIEGVELIEQGDAENILGDYYDMLSPYFERLYSLDVEGIDYLDRPYEIHYIGININILHDILFGN